MVKYCKQKAELSTNSTLNFISPIKEWKEIFPPYNPSILEKKKIFIYYIIYIL